MSQVQARKHLNQRVDFAKLSKAQQRTMIATDVLAQLELKQIEATEGTYVYMEFSKALTIEAFGKLPMNEAIVKAESCAACALGSCLLTLAARTGTHNGLGLYDTVGGFNGAESAPASRVVRDNLSMRGQLGAYFSREQLDLIESAFELDNMGEYTDDGSNPPQIEAAIKFGTKRVNPGTRLKAIMHNIIENCGEFKP